MNKSIFEELAFAFGFFGAIAFVMFPPAWLLLPVVLVVLWYRRKGGAS